MQGWSECKNILCIRADNMGDLIMSSPAIRALKQTFNCKITVLTSAMGSLIAPHISCIDEVLVHDLPWIKTNTPVTQKEFQEVIEEIRSHNFDAAVIFSVYSQNPLPAAMLAYMAGIANRAAYCRENPYHLLTHWVAEKEPFTYIHHQVQRDLDLVASVGAQTNDDSLYLHFSDDAKKNVLQKLSQTGVDVNKPWIIFHPGVSEKKREYPIDLWMQTGQLIASKLQQQIIITGASSEANIAHQIQQGIGEKSFSVAGLFTIEEFIALIHLSILVISVNTSTVHIAAATQTPVIVLYALTNPQHTPWKVPCKVLPFTVTEALKSNNQIVDFVSKKFNKVIPFPSPQNIFKAAQLLLTKSSQPKATSFIQL